MALYVGADLAEKDCSFLFCQDHDKMKDRRAGISSETLFFCCIHAINTALLPPSFPPSQYFLFHRKEVTPHLPSLPLVFVLSPFHLLGSGSGGQKRERKTMDAAPLVKENASVLLTSL